MNKIKLVLKKELKATFRDKKALFTILLPILIYPVILVFFMGFSQIVNSNLEQVVSVVAVDENVPTDFRLMLEVDPRIDVLLVDSNDDIEDSATCRVSHHAEGQKDIFILTHNSTVDTSQQGARRVEENFNIYLEQLKYSILEQADILPQFETIVNIERQDISGDEGGRILAMALGMIFPLIIVIYGITGTYTISSDLSAGEKERETLETIFSVPVKRFEIIIAKLLTCVIVGLASGMVNILAMFPLAYGITSQIPELNLSISFSLFAYLFLMLIPIMILTSAFFIGLGMFAKTYQESQSYGSILLMVFMALCYIPLVPNLEISKITLSIPITNSLLLMKEGFLGSYSLANTALVLGINLGVSIIGIIIMNKLFKSDWVIFGGGN